MQQIEKLQIELQTKQIPILNQTERIILVTRANGEKNKKKNLLIAFLL